MAKSTELPNSKYGVPIYGASWVPPSAIRSDPRPAPEGENHDGEDEPSGDGSPASISADNYLVFAGGGGEGRSGIPNALLLAQFDFASNFLSDEPITKLGTGADLPYRMAVHPGGDGVICSFRKSCRWYKWDAVKSTDEKKLGLKMSDRVLNQIEDVGQQLALTFNNDGSVLALGGEDGKLRIFKWPSMESILDEANAHSSVKDLDFSPDGKFIVSVGSGGPGRVWDVTTSSPVAALSKENDEVFGFCRFSQNSEKKPVLYITSVHGKGGSIVKWDTSSWKRVSSKHIVRDPICAFNVSADGKLLAIGTIQGDVVIINSNMRVLQTVRKAHLGLVTSLMFSSDARALVSVSMDSSARVTLIKDEKKTGSSLWVIILIILLAIAMYYAKTEGILL